MSITDTDTTAGPADGAGWDARALDEILAHDGGGRPVLFTNARILTMAPLIGTMTGGLSRKPCFDWR